MSVCCRRAGEQDRDAIKQLWQLSFEDDSADDTERFLQVFSLEENAFVLTWQERVQSMLFLLPTVIESGEERVTVGYIYAGATHPDARGKGFYRRLLGFAFEWAKQNGMAALLLRPATPTLEESYRRMGFTVPLYAAEYAVQATQCVKGTPLSAAEFAAKRRAILRGRGQAFVDWDDNTLEYVCSWCDAVAIDDHACALIAQDGAMVWEYITSDSSVLLPMDTTVRTFGDDTVLALMRPTSGWVPSKPIWFGYGME